MILRKIISLLLLLATILCSLSLFSCHKNGKLDSFIVPKSFDTSKQYEITFWAKNENNETQRDVYAKAVEEFQKLYPNIKVTLRNFTDYGEIYNNVITNISINSTPNVCITYPDHIATYIAGENVVVPLDSLIKNKKYGLGGTALKFDSPSVDEIIPEFYEEGKIDGEQYALPFMRSTEACYINIDLLNQLGFTNIPSPLTWDFVWEVCDYAMSLGKDANGNYIANGQKTFIPFIYKSTDNMMISMLEQLNAPYSKDDGTVEIFNETTKEILYEIAPRAKSGAFSTFQISSYPGNFLNAGQCIFAIDSTAGSTWMGTNAPSVEFNGGRIEFNIAVTAIPQYNPEEPKMISQGPSLCIFNKEDSGEVLASWLFAQFLLTNEVQIAYSQTEGYIPVTSKAHNSAEYQDYLNRAGENNSLYYDVKIEATKLLLINTDNTFTTPVFNGSTSLRSAAGNLVELTVSSATKNRVINEDFMELLFTRVTSLDKLDQIVTKEGPKKQEFGELPNESKILIGGLAAVWVLIGTYFGYTTIKKKKS